ncbi:hypothetical protein [Cysteiniphilum marinum]|uniref:hypothetical protein n=1 Tax=Cysteiniphilum marinum TaxID=2774191 RepID=UPI00193B193F|nr:hypothetical protein [Cysteiniphilum marinum]
MYFKRWFKIRSTKALVFGVFWFFGVGLMALTSLTGCTHKGVTVTSFEQVKVADVSSVQEEVNHAQNYVYQQRFF